MQFLQPHLVLQHFSILPGMRIAELHSASGHFTPHLRKLAGEYGIVHSFLHNEKLDAIELPEAVDRVIIVNVPSGSNFHSLFKKAHKILKPEGEMIVIDWKFGDVPEEKAINLAGMTGFHRKKHFHAGDHHYGTVFKKL